MHCRIVSLAGVSAAFALFATGCSNMSSGENQGMFGNLGGASGSGIGQASGMTSAESFATGGSSGAIVAATTFIIAKHQASERQRRVAEERARAAYSRMAAKRHAVPPTKPTASSSKKLSKKLPRYIAVDTVKDEKTSPRAKKSVMIWDTEAQQVVGNDVYDVQTPPPVGSTARFETYSAEYVGAGS